MRGLIRKLQARFDAVRGSDEGATIVFVAVVLVALLALTAFAVDFGRMYEERRQLQNGADAAALAIAEDCARDLCDGSYDEYAVAETYVDENARDGAANAWLVDLDLTAQTVTVHNRTEDPGGDHQYDMLFAGIVGFDGFTVGAEATVAWGGLVSPLASLPIIVSECEWERSYSRGGAGDGAHLFKKPDLDAMETPWLTPPAWWTAGSWDNDQDGSDDTVVPSSFLNITEPGAVPVVLTFHGDPDEDDDPCTFNAGQDGEDSLHGGFGWLDLNADADIPCSAEVWGDFDPESGEYGTVGELPGHNGQPPQACKKFLDDILLGADRNGTMVFIPYFDLDNGLNGQNGEYEISGYGAFWTVGYNFGGFRDHIEPLRADPCRPGNNSLQALPPDASDPDSQHGFNNRCLAGYFLDVVYQGPGTIGPGGHGVTVIKFTS